jgi:Holliday junction resolvase RusA-like endonuclease
MKLKFFFPGIPFSKQSVRANPVYGRDGSPVVYTDERSGRKRVLIRYHQPKAITDQENNIRAIAISQLPPAFKPFDGEVHVCRLDFVFPPLKSFPKIKLMNIVSGSTEYKTTKPDLLDNLSKGFFDSLEGILYLNDSQICETISTRKIYGMTPGISLEVEGFYTNTVPRILFAEALDFKCD